MKAYETLVERLIVTNGHGIECCRTAGPAYIVGVKTVKKLKTKSGKQTCGSRSPDKAEFSHFRLYCCFAKEKAVNENNVSRIITHAYRHFSSYQIVRSSATFPFVCRRRRSLSI